MKYSENKGIASFVTNSISRHVFPRDGGAYWDIDALYVDPGLFSELAFDMSREFVGRTDLVLSTEMSGILAQKIASHLHLPLVVARKAGTSPLKGIMVGMREGRKSIALEVTLGAIPKGSRVLLVDVVIEKGVVVEVLEALVNLSFAKAIGIASLKAGSFRDSEKLVYSVIP